METRKKDIVTLKYTEKISFADAGGGWSMR